MKATRSPVPLKSRSSRQYLVQDAAKLKAAEAAGPAKIADGFAVLPASPLVLGWPDPARRELAAHLMKLGLPAISPKPLEVVRQAELDAGAGMDPRVTPAKMDAAMARATRASKMTPAPQAALLGFSRLIDAKHFLDGKTVSALAAAATEPPSGADQLLAAIESGPPGPAKGETAWNRPNTKTEVVASLVRHLVLGAGASRQMQLNAELAGWLEDTLQAQGISFQYAMGGAGAFGANLASAQPGVSTSFFSKDPLPARIAENFTARVSVTDRQGQTTAAHDAGDARPARINFALEYAGGHDFSVCGRTQLKIDGELRDLKTTGGSRIILSTPEPFEAGFGEIDDDALQKMGKDRDLFFFAGVHYFTRAHPEAGAEKARLLGARLDVMKRANPKLVRHYQYVVPKVAANELGVMRNLAGHLDSMSLNSVEVSALLHRLSEGGLTEWRHDATPKREEAERTDRMLEGAEKLLACMGLSRVHLHGHQGDLLVTSADIDPERQVLAHLKARQIASMKTANPSGEIRSADDLWPVLPTVKGEGLAQVEDFADQMRERFGLSASERDQVATRWFHKDEASGLTYVFTPSRGIHDRSGGTVSLGDTIDLSALIYERSIGRNRPLLHPSSF